MSSQRAGTDINVQYVKNCINFWHYRNTSNCPYLECIWWTRLDIKLCPGQDLLYLSCHDKSSDRLMYQNVDRKTRFFQWPSQQARDAGLLCQINQSVQRLDLCWQDVALYGGMCNKWEWPKKWIPSATELLWGKTKLATSWAEKPELGSSVCSCCFSQIMSWFQACLQKV